MGYNFNREKNNGRNKRKNIKACIIFVDFSKSLDSIDRKRWQKY